ncbi:MAG: alkene reductase [Bacteroidia bacterium]|nr:alkene reductase [Bacteroidia bacterium]
MTTTKLFSKYTLGTIELRNRIVMAPMTRSRAIGNIPNDLMATYYEQRAGAGLIVTEGTSPSPNGLGYSRIPGLFNESQVEGWKKVTEAVHFAGGRIFVQLMHTGRIGHSLNLPSGASVLAPSAIKAAGQMWTDQEGMQDFPEPKAMSPGELKLSVKEFENSAVLAMKAGFDGVELHSANGYLLEQFLSPISNHRTDKFGGSIENRCRFVLEVVDVVSKAIGKEKTAIRLSPFGVASDMPHYPEIEETYSYLAEQLNNRGIVYVHLVDHSAMGAPKVPFSIKKTIHKKFRNTMILTGGYNQQSAEKDLENGFTDLVGFGRQFINNPDLVSRFKNSWSLSTVLDSNTFYSVGEKGYTDYPAYSN